MLYTLLFFSLSSKCSLFHNANWFGSCIIHILYTGCAEIKKNNSGAKGLNEPFFFKYEEISFEMSKTDSVDLACVSDIICVSKFAST